MMSESAKSAREKARKVEDRGTLYVCVFGLILTATLALLHFTSSGGTSRGTKYGSAGGRGISFTWGGGIDWARKALGSVFHWKGSGKFSKAPGAPVMDIPFDQREEEAEDLVHADRVGVPGDFEDPAREGSDRLPNAQSLGLTSSQGAAGGGGSGSARTGRFSESAATQGSEATEAPPGTAKSAATRSPGAVARAQASHSGAGRRGIGAGAQASPNFSQPGFSGPSAQATSEPSSPPPARVDQSEAIVIKQVRENLQNTNRALTRDIAAARALGGVLSANVPFYNTRPSRVVAEVILNNPLKSHEVPPSERQARWRVLNQIAQTLQPYRIESSNALKAGGALMGTLTKVQGQIRSASGSISSAMDAIAKQKTALDGMEKIPLLQKPAAQLLGKLDEAQKLNDNAYLTWKHKGGPLGKWLENSGARLAKEKRLLNGYLKGSLPPAP